MTSHLQFEIPSALDYFAALVADDASLPVLEAAICVAQDDFPELDVQAVLAEVDTLAERLRRRIPQDAGPMQRLRLLNPYFFQELSFAGNVNNFYDRRNSYLSEVLRTRHGIPITLALLYVELATQIGLKAYGVAFPGHFLIKVHLPRGEVVIDPFDGRSLARETLLERVLPFQQQQGLADPDEVPLGLYLQAATPRAVIARLLRNLKEIHRAARDTDRLVAVMNRLVVLLPDDVHELRDRGLALADNGRHDLARADLRAYLDQRPQAADGKRLREWMASWGRGASHFERRR
jgi:regulator of sirC expression with transglutaminase-like and TPR domain